ncbi:MAG: hypothetical protein AB1Z98_18955 [Nannocystaceae bacterium]
MASVTSTMRYVKLTMMGFAGLGLVLGLAYGLLGAGGHGIFTLAMCALPLVLGGLTEVSKKGFPRWMAGLSAVAMLIAAMKTQSDHGDMSNIMMVTFFGMVLSLVLVIKPQKASG